MTTNDPRIRKVMLCGQELVVPTTEAWREILREGSLDGMPLPLPNWIALGLDTYSGFAATSLGLIQRRGRWWAQPLLRLGVRIYLVNYEDVICEHCGQRCGPSASIDRVAYPASRTTLEAEQLIEPPVRDCPHCTKELRRRQTVWLAVENN